MGFFSIPRALSPWIEPGDLPRLMEAMSNRLIFPCKCRGKQTVWPDPQSVGSTCRVRRVAVVPRLPTLRPVTPCGRARVPSARDLAALVRASAPRSARDCLRQTLASLPRWQSASSTPTRAADGFSWTSPSASEAVVPGGALFSTPRAFSWLTYR
jgi:hypothetical protein